MKKLEKQKLYDSFVQLEADAKRMLARIDEMQTDLMQVLERDAELEIENQHLRERLQEIQAAADKKSERPKTAAAPRLSKSRANLKKLYKAGFHVCNQMYGSRLDDDEPCAFCLDVIYGERR
ncbi:initiation-control protein [Loigolactobacillus rennini DSM 20253]|uniref:Initiation-control protein n=1 Tax=Loigolactobacillus rennini DSM 20253 TaxID=1423796 RepID=A0A0R2CTY3_9LACO|nr:initiation-control protein [Loigolactobacillus rennini DSM 20253]